MKQVKRFAALALILTLLFAFVPYSAFASSTPTDFTRAEDVVYVTVNGTVVNWGARNEDCVFLSTYAQAYYADSLSWDVLSQKSGGTGIGNAYTSDLYKALQTMMKSKHTKIQGYQETRPFYCYTDCVRNDYSQVCSFYSGTLVNGVWNGKTYNREHTWPNSKGLGGSDEDDIMMLRPTIASENSSRGNTAYGESSGYFDPGADVRGDCARITLYIYTRWGNTDRMWGKSGVMESLEVLLKWMEEDPVDTWEMGRNDAVQSITGVRNAFVDYPEYAWLLFGEEVPVDMVTPSGKAATMQPPPVETTTPPTTQATEPAPPPTQTPTPPVTTTPPETTAPTTQSTVAPTETTAPPTTQATEPATQPTNPTTQPTAPTVQPTNPAVTAPVTPPADTEQVGSDSVWIWIVIAVVLMGGAVAVFVIWKKKLPPFHK